MNKYQARCALTAGKKVTHQHFTPSEYLYEESGKILTEEGYKMPLTTYNPWSLDGAPEGWGIFEDDNEKC